MDFDEVMPEEKAENLRRLNRQLSRAYRMYIAYRRDDGEIMTFTEYVQLFHDIEPETTKKWVSNGELT